jgi:plastocyanin
VPPTTVPPSGPPAVTITSTGFAPQEVTIPVGSRVTFVNMDRTGHEIWGGVDHASRDCDEVEAAGFLVPGQRRETAVFTAPKTCRFHDHANLGNPAFQGRIFIQ